MKKYWRIASVLIALLLGAGATMAPSPRGNIMNNVVTDFNEVEDSPRISATAYIHPQASVIGAAEIGDQVMVAPFASVRGDEGEPIHVGNESNLQDGVVLHALETHSEGEEIPGRSVEVDGRKYAVYIGERVSLAHQSQVHGPAYVGDDTFIGMQALVFNARVGRNCVVEPAAAVIGVTVPDGRYVKAGLVVTDQTVADNLPLISDGYAYQKTNHAVVHVNKSLAHGYHDRSNPSTGRTPKPAPHP